ncbi:hypothetical protein [Enterococcus alishanensis]
MSGKIFSKSAKKLKTAKIPAQLVGIFLFCKKSPSSMTLNRFFNLRHLFLKALNQGLLAEK